jgi:hypothetical protein
MSSSIIKFLKFNYNRQLITQLYDPSTRKINFIHCCDSSSSSSYSRGVEVSIVRLGEADLSHRNDFVADYKKEKFISHPNYNSQTDINDIALIKLAEAVRMSKNVRPACLHQNDKEILMGKNAIAIGFGGVTYGDNPSEVLLKVNLTVVHKTRCNKIFKATLLKSQICIKGNKTENGVFADTCQGGCN